MGKVRVIGGREPDQDLIDCLRELLVDAENGDLTCLAGIAEYATHGVDNIHAGNADWAAVAGRLHRLAYDMVVEEDDED